VNDTLQAVVEINPDALSIAASLDAERKAGHCRGPLHGLPILLKNNIATADKMQNTAGSYALLGAIVPKDSGAARKLREAGAVILGKANLSQWSYMRAYNISHGWSSYGGQTVGAYYENQDPSGSSSGSSVAVGVGLALAALGTDTGGSISLPCGVGALSCIKPTVGLVSRNLVVPISEHLDTVGPMATTLKDAAFLLEAIAGKDPDDNYTSAIPFERMPNYVKSCRKDGLRGRRIGVPQNVLEILSTNRTLPVIKAFDAAIETLEALGATIVPNTNFTGFETFLNSTSGYIIADSDFLTDLPKYISQLTSNPSGVDSVASLRDFTRNTPIEDYPDRDVAVFDKVVDVYNFPNTDPRFWLAYQDGLRLTGPLGLTGALTNFSLDALILPTQFATPFPAVQGAPIVTVPMGFYPGNTALTPNVPRGDLNALGPNLPIGLSFLGKRFSEEVLIGMGCAFEARTKFREKVRPAVLPKTELRDVVARKGCEL
jgi:amidase